MRSSPASPPAPDPRTVTQRLERRRFWPLPRPLRADGQPRRTGVEIEFAGMDEVAAAEVVQGLWGGRLEPIGPRRFRLAGAQPGAVTVELDSTLPQTEAGAMLADALGDLVPTEVVTPPLAPEELPEADRLVATLRAAGARGTRDGLLLGFGLHLNPEVADESAAFILPVVRAYALLEDWLRAADPIDAARRLLPFVDPWPRALMDALAAGEGWDLPTLTERYLALSPSRNRGLDLLPLLQHLQPAQVAAVLPEAQRKGGRPTFHYRLPEARVDEPAWSVAYEWNRWVVVERVAARPDLLAELAAAWQAHRAALTTLRGDWATSVERRLRAARIWEG